jgi:CDP-paratose 2-epimerase
MAHIVALDNLRRRGSELILNRLQEAEIPFLHGDIRNPEDFPHEPFDVLLECSAEASVLAGYGTSPNYLLQTNLNGAIHCLEYCRQHKAAIVFLSTSRVYSVEPLTKLAFTESSTRFELSPRQTYSGASELGISEEFSTKSYRSLYGTTKLAAEMLTEEYRHAYGIKAIINRCGVLAGPWQLARGDQGIFTYWLASHYFKRPLKYIGFEGTGKQVRDMLHPEDLADLIIMQLRNLTEWDGTVHNVGGGRDISLSLREATKLCEEISGNKVQITFDPNPRPMDIPCYLSDCRQLYSQTSWRPQQKPHQILSQTFEWIRANEEILRGIL